MLAILDGWGWRDEDADNAVRQARTPNFDRLWTSCPHAFLHTSGKHVGLPAGQMGNSEVGHLNIGAGRLVMQDLPRITEAIESGEIERAPALTRLIARLRQSGGTCHLRGLVSPGGVHSHQDHAAALARILADTGVPTVVHAFTDGRDTPPRSAAVDIAQLQEALPPAVSIATICGRYHAMDRDKRWDRVANAYRAIVEADGPHFPDAAAVIADAYAHDISDEFVVPAVVARFSGMRDGDGVLCFNFRADRVREILSALLDPAFLGFARRRSIRFAAAAGMTQYSEQLDTLLQTIFPPQSLKNILGEVVADAGARQCAWRRPRSTRTSPISSTAAVRAVSRRGPHHGPVAEGRDVRPAPEMSARHHEHRRSKQWLRQLRRDRHELCQRRHGRSHRASRGGDQGGRDCRHRARPHHRGHKAGRRRAARHRRPWQLRNDARSRDGAARIRPTPPIRCRS